MKKLTAGLITSGVVGALGITYAMSDKRMRNKISKGGKKVLDKAGNYMSKMDIF